MNNKESMNLGGIENKIFNAGREISKIEIEFKKAFQKSIWYHATAENLAEGRFTYHYWKREPMALSKKEFGEEIRNYQAGLNDDLKNYNSLKKDFLGLDYFNDKGGPWFKLELDYRCSKNNLELAILALKK